MLHRILRQGAEYWFALIFLGLHLLIISWPGRKVLLATSNLTTNLIRLEASKRETPVDLIIAGSSITGRLLEENFSTPSKVMNLGLDGCGSLQALEVILKSDRHPSVVLLEVNTLKPGHEKNFELVTKARSERRERAGRSLSFLKSAERPVDLTYEFIRNLKQPAATAGAQLTWQDAMLVQTAPLPPLEDAVNRKFEASLRASLAEFRKREPQCKLAFILIPDSAPDNPWHQPELTRAVAAGQEFGVPVFDLRFAAGTETLSWSDGVHLTVPAAKVVSKFVEETILPRAK